MILKITTILVCIYAVSAEDTHQKMVQRMSDHFEVSVEKVGACLNKTKVSSDELTVLGHSLDNPDKKTEHEDSERRASCALVCIAQEKGVMIGSKLQMNKVHDQIDYRKVPRKVGPVVHEYADTCAEEVGSISDECQVGLQFIKCIIKKVDSEYHRA